MSLRTATKRLDNVFSAVVLILSAVAWAYAGFPYFGKVVAFGCLVTVLFGALTWMESRH
jgi:hypothetical protein